MEIAAFDLAAFCGRASRLVICLPYRSIYRDDLSMDDTLRWLYVSILWRSCIDMAVLMNNFLLLNMIDPVSFK